VLSEADHSGRIKRFDEGGFVSGIEPDDVSFGLGQVAVGLVVVGGAAAPDSATTTVAPNVPVAQAVMEPGVLLAMDLEALTVEQLMEVMTACASQMMQRMATPTAQGREHS
jgi:hypothetical protein